jgi:hypothetical protein
VPFEREPLYYWDHRDEVDREISAQLDEYERERAAAPPSILAIRLRAKTKGDR